MLQKMKQLRWLFTIVLALALSLCLGLGLALADGDSGQVRVIVENATYPQADGAPWEGTLVDKWVDIDDNSTMMSCLVTALGDYSQTGADSNYITEINGLAAFAGGDESGWMGSLNDWMVNEGFGEFTVASGKLQADDVIRIMYSRNGWGADLGGSWANNDKTLKDLSFDQGSLAPDFASATAAYTLTVPADTGKVTVTPTAANKNYQVRIKVGDGAYLRPGARTVDVAEGTVITVTCGDPSWPSMNGADGDAVSYTVTVNVVPKVTANITLSMQQDNKFLLAPQTVAVSSDLAESYGYTDSVLGQVSALDALVKIHELRYAGEFTKDNAGEYLVVGASGYVTKFNKEESSSILFAVDGDYPNDLNSPYSSWTGYTGYTVNQAPVADGGSVEFLVPQDTDMYADCYTWFQQGGERISKLTVRAGQSFALELQGYMFAFGGSFVGEDRVNNGGLGPMPEVQLATADPESGVLTGLEGKKTDDDGLVTLAFDDPGTYYLSASGEVSAYYGMFDTYVFSPWLEVTVLPSGGPDEVSAYWKDFRNSDVNMAITDVPTPTSAEKAAQLWANKLGSGWSEAPSVQIIVNDSLIVMCGTKLYKLDLATGEVKAQATMVAAPSYSYTPPTYGEGMIFCPLGGGRIQAFNAKTLESLWVYTDSLGGQALSPITYSDGYIYTGFWNGEVADAAYVCVSVVDEDTTRTDEAKASAWRDVVQGGFYWAGSVAVGDYVIYGTDNGVRDADSAGSHLISRNKVSGALSGSLELNGDQRSSIAYADGRVYFTTKGGGLYSAALDAASGALSDLKNNNFGAQSTSTPVVYKGRVYLGCGSGISDMGSSGNLLVCDADSLDMLFAVGLQGYPQCSMLLSTAYEQSDGYVYVYSTYNNTPGGISLIKVKSDAATAADAELIEVFTPEAEQYCICSVICGPDGTLYYKNDSGNVFAVREQPEITPLFPDVPASHWAYSYINALAARGVINGYPDGNFHPEAQITRADFVVMLSRLSGESLPEYDGRFKDVTADKYYAKAVTWAASAGITLGYGAGDFRPAALISRQEMAAMLYRYADYMKIALPEGTELNFSDSASIADYARGPVAAMSLAGIINGYPDGSFKPAGNASRAEASKMMYVLDSLK